MNGARMRSAVLRPPLTSGWVPCARAFVRRYQHPLRVAVRAVRGACAGVGPDLCGVGCGGLDGHEQHERRHERYGRGVDRGCAIRRRHGWNRDGCASGRHHVVAGVLCVQGRVCGLRRRSAVHGRGRIRVHQRANSSAPVSPQHFDGGAGVGARFGVAASTSARTHTLDLSVTRGFVRPEGLEGAARSYPVWARHRVPSIEHLPTAPLRAVAGVPTRVHSRTLTTPARALRGQPPGPHPSRKITTS